MKELLAIAIADHRTRPRPQADQEGGKTMTEALIVVALIFLMLYFFRGGC